LGAGAGGKGFAPERFTTSHEAALRRGAPMIEAGLWKAKPSRVRHRQWRTRKECRGEMVQMDTSIHAWFEGRAPEEPVLIAMIDDATSRLYARFFVEDSTRTNMTLLRGYLRRWGRPVALYADRASHFQTTREATVEEQLQGREPETQIGRALRELDIRYIAASSPQAKGRIERCFRTLQDRLVKELRLRNICDLQDANDYLEQQFLPRWNRRFVHTPACSHDAHRGRKGLDLDAILALQQTRTVANDYTVRFQNQILQIERRGRRRGLRNAKVIVEERLDGSLRIRWRQRYLKHTPVAGTPVGPRPPSVPATGTPIPSLTHPDRTFLLCAKEDISIVR
jgi:hypothetical protein